MCRSKEEGNRRCEVTDRTRAMAAARRRILRANAELAKDKGAIPEHRERLLMDKIITARAELKTVRDHKC